jgi:hypothetical protein
MTRRQVLQGITVLLGGIVSSSLAGAILGCDRRRVGGSDWRPRSLTGEQDELISTIAELILPATDTPGAREAGVNQFIDLLLTDWLDPEESAEFLAGLAELERDCQGRFDRSFLQLTPEEQLAVLVPLDEEAAELRQAARAAGRREVEDPSFFLTMKEWTLAGYYTSEIGMTQELQHLRISGSYQGCMPLTEVGRSWA